MRVRVLATVVIIALVLVGIGFMAQQKLLRNRFPPAARRSGHKVVSLSAVLKAHFDGANKPWPSYTQKGVRIPPDGSSQIEQKVILSTDGTSIRYEQGEVAVYGQTFIFDGRTIVEHTFRAGLEEGTRTLEGMDADTVKFQMATFGVLPVLKRLSAPGSHITMIGSTAEGDQFQVDTAAGSWYVYTNRYHLIERVKVGDVSIDFQDYRSVDGLTLPFSQSVTQGTLLKYRLNINSVVVNPTFPKDFFTLAKF